MAAKAEPTISPAGIEKDLGVEEKKILEYVRLHGTITRKNVTGLLRVSTSTASRIIKKMVENNLLKRNGKARSTSYTVK